MDRRTKYRTRQREMLLEYLRNEAGRHVTAGDVCAYFETQGTPIGRSTVYRRLEQLVDEGLVGKYTIDPGDSACFEYIGADCHRGSDACYHCKCERCGRLLHLHCEEIEAIRAHLSSEHNFRMDPQRTVFYGLCERCWSTEGEGAV